MDRVCVTAQWYFYVVATLASSPSRLISTLGTLRGPYISGINYNTPYLSTTNTLSTVRKHQSLKIPSSTTRALFALIYKHL